MDRLSRSRRIGFRQAVRSLSQSLLPDRLIRYHLPSSMPGPVYSFDDGPHPELTPRLLDALASRSIRGWFFLIGEKAAAQPELTRRIADEGHLVGNHSWSHPAPGTFGTKAYLDDVARSRASIAEITGSDPFNYRPPHGHLTTGTALGLWLSSNRIVLWSADPKDYLLDDHEILTQRVREIAPAGNDIVLMHDTNAATVAAFEQGLFFQQESAR